MKWYKRDPEAFAGGTAELSLEEVGAYTRIIDLIYSRDGNVPDDERFIAMALRCDVRVWRRIRKRLVDCGKIQTSAGLIVNLRATSEISYAQVRMKKDQKRNENKVANLTSAPILTTTTTIREEVSMPRKRGRNPKIPMPDNWHPMEALSSQDQLELDRFKNHALANDRRCANWFAAWRNWKTSPYRSKNETLRDGSHSISAAFAKLDKLFDGEPETSEVPRQTNLRLLSG